jgi:hypothetical protein
MKRHCPQLVDENEFPVRARMGFLERCKIHPVRYVAVIFVFPHSSLSKEKFRLDATIQPYSMNLLLLSPLGRLNAEELL